MKETDIHFQIERVQSRSKRSKTFDATVELKSLKNGAGVIRNERSQKNTASSREKFSGNGVKRKSARLVR